MVNFVTYRSADYLRPNTLYLPQFIFRSCCFCSGYQGLTSMSTEFILEGSLLSQSMVLLLLLLLLPSVPQRGGGHLSPPRSKELGACPLSDGLIHAYVFASVTPPSGIPRSSVWASVWHYSSLRLPVMLALLMPPSGMPHASVWASVWHDSCLSHASVAASVSPIYQDELKTITITL